MPQAGAQPQANMMAGMQNGMPNNMMPNNMMANNMMGGGMMANANMMQQPNTQVCCIYRSNSLY